MPDAVLQLAALPAGVASYGLTITSDKDFGAGLQLQNTGGGRKYGVYANNKGEFVVGDDNSARAVMFVDLAGRLHADVAALSSRSAKKDIAPLSEEEGAVILKQVLETPLVRSRYRTEDDAAPARLGVIAEDAPKDIVDAGIAMGSQQQCIRSAREAVRHPACGGPGAGGPPPPARGPSGAAPAATGRQPRRGPLGPGPAQGERCRRRVRARG